MRTVIKNSILGVIGGAVYVCLEMIWRGHSHWTMFLLGAVCFMYSGIQNEYTSWDKPLLLQSVQTAVFITVNEFFCRNDHQPLAGLECLGLQQSAF